MSRTNPIVRTFVRALALLFCATAQVTLAETGKEFENPYGDENTMFLATGHPQPISQAPATVTVITQEQMLAMGARTLDEVLQTVPGVHVTTERGYTSSPILRGLFSATNSALLPLFDGVPLGRALAGTTNSYNRILVRGLERIEIIRGPGSALYGADAVAGVINIITKSGAGITGTHVGAQSGSNDTHDAWVLTHQRLGTVDLDFQLTARTTDGAQLRIDADAATAFDRRFGTVTSLAPGSVNDEFDVIDSRLQLRYGPWTAWGTLNGSRGGLGAGFASALDPNGSLERLQYSANLRYDGELTDTLVLNGVVSYFNKHREIEATLLPPGTFGIFRDGIRNDNEFDETQFYAEGSLLYSGIAGHTIKPGIGFYKEQLQDGVDKRNYVLFPNAIVPTPTFATTDVLGVQSSVADFSRKVFFAYLQDEWAFAPDWVLTTGLRFDHFEDVGSTLNPRIGLVWNNALHWTTKLLYARGFRAPSYIEARTQNNLIAVGNRNLDPETIDSVELVLNYHPPRLKTSATLYGYRMKDRIVTASDPALFSALTFENARDDLWGYGVELDMSYDVTSHFRVRANYTFQNTEDGVTNASLGSAPMHQAYLEGDWRFASNWRLNANLNGVFNRRRAAGDPRPKVDDYVLANAFLERRNLWQHVDVAIGVRNLFDRDARAPSGSASTLPGDVPLPGRAIFGQINVKFD